MVGFIQLETGLRGRPVEPVETVSLKSVGWVTPEVKLAESPLSGELFCSFVPRYDSMKQERFSNNCHKLLEKL